MGRKKGLTVGKVRSSLYSSARLLGDVNSVARGTIFQRILNRILGNFFTQMIRGIVRGITGGGKR